MTIDTSLTGWGETFRGRAVNDFWLLELAHSHIQNRWQSMANGEGWFDERPIVSYQCSARDILYYLQELLDRGRTFSPLGQHPLEGSFLQGVCCKCLVSRLLVPFDPLESVGLRFLSLITALLLALSTVKRVSCLPFALHVLKWVYAQLRLYV